MKKLFKLTVLLGIMGVASWLGGSHPASAIDRCVDLEGTFCSPPGAQTYCILPNGNPSYCTCGDGNHWRCIF